MNPLILYKTLKTACRISKPYIRKRKNSHKSHILASFSHSVQNDQTSQLVPFQEMIRNGTAFLSDLRTILT